MKNDLPYLNQARLDCIFDHVYDVVDPVHINESKAAFEDQRLTDFFAMLKAMQNVDSTPKCNPSIHADSCNGTAKNTE